MFIDDVYMVDVMGNVQGYHVLMLSREGPITVVDSDFPINIVL